MHALRHSLIFGIIFGLIGLAVGLYINHYNIIQIGNDLIVPAAASGLVTASLLWWLFVARSAKFTFKRGIWISALVGLLVHPVMWYFDVIRANLCYYVLHCPSCAHCPAPMTLLQGFKGSLFFSYISLYYWGWLSIPIGAVIGGVFILLVKRLRFLKAC